MSFIVNSTKKTKQINLYSCVWLCCNHGDCTKTNCTWKLHFNHIHHFTAFFSIVLIDKNCNLQRHNFTVVIPPPPLAPRCLHATSSGTKATGASLFFGYHIRGITENFPKETDHIESSALKGAGCHMAAFPTADHAGDELDAK